MTEQEIRQYCKGNNEILADFYLNEHDALLLFLYRFISDTELAKEVLFNVFIKFHELDVAKREKFQESPEYFISYFYRSLKNELISFLRKGKIKNMKYVEYDSNIHGGKKSTTIEVDEFDKMVSILTDREKELIQLYKDGFNNHEIADQKGISINTVKNTLTSARNKLKKVWYTILIFACII